LDEVRANVTISVLGCALKGHLMNPLFNLVLLVGVGITLAYSTRQFWIMLRLGGLPRRGDKEPLRKEDYPFLYWGIALLFSLGLLVMIGGEIVLLSRLVS